MRAGVRTGVRTGVRSGVRSKVRAGVRTGARTGVRLVVQIVADQEQKRPFLLLLVQRLDHQAHPHPSALRTDADKG